MARLQGTRALTFDLFGTVLDLGGSLTPFIADFLSGVGAPVTAEEFWEDVLDQALTTIADEHQRTSAKARPPGSRQ